MLLCYPQHCWLLHRNYVGIYSFSYYTNIIPIIYTYIYTRYLSLLHFLKENYFFYYSYYVSYSYSIMLYS